VPDSGDTAAISEPQRPQPIAQLTEMRPHCEIAEFHPSTCYLLSPTYKNSPAVVLGTGSADGHIAVFSADRSGHAQDFIGVWQPGTTHEQVLAHLGYQLLR
jgi:hypothetical protein